MIQKRPYTTFLRRRWYLPYGSIVCSSCAKRLPTQDMEYLPPAECGVCKKEKQDSRITGKQFIVSYVTEKPPQERKLPPMRNIMFTPPNHEKILSSEKTMTARLWLIKPPPVGSLVTASTGYNKDTRFAILRITGVHEWDGSIYGNAEEATGLSMTEIAKREGFEAWRDFLHAYFLLNASKLDDERRTHYFISFEVESIINA